MSAVAMNRVCHPLLFLMGLGVAITTLLTAPAISAEAGQPLLVPEQYPTIQAAVDEAADGDTVLIAPGIYHESVQISGKSVHLVSWYLNSRDPMHIKQTVLDGSIHPDPTPEDDIDDVRPYVILIKADAGDQSSVMGLTIRDGDDGISCYAKAKILFNRFINNTDAIDYEGGGGECRYNHFVANDDDAIDLDLDCEVIVENNEIRDNDDDGIEIRLHEYSGPCLQVVIRDNRIIGNGEDGIQIIDYPDVSNRHIIIERNVIADNSMAGIGMMSDGVTLEDYRAAQIPEPIEIVNNTFSGNHMGVVGGAKVQLLNNIFANQANTSLKKVAGDSVITHNLFWKNGAEPMACDLSHGSVFSADPQLGSDYRPSNDSYSIQRGTAKINLEGPGSQTVTPVKYLGEAPDLGAYETR